MMAYHTEEQLPVYGFLAEQFAICDHWFCSVGGATMPNRCYAAAGNSNGRRDNSNRPSLGPWPPSSGTWVMTHGVGTARLVPMLWLVDPEYGLRRETVRAYFDKRDILGHRSFLE